MGNRGGVDASRLGYRGRFGGGELRILSCQGGALVGTAWLLLQCAWGETASGQRDASGEMGTASGQRDASGEVETAFGQRDALGETAFG